MNALAPNNPVAQDYSLASSHTAALTGQPDGSNAIVNIRFIHDTDRARPAIPTRGTLRQLWTTIVNYQSQGFGVFINCNEMDGNGLTLANVQSIRTHVVDLDNLSAQQNCERASQFNPSPSFAVQSSPGRFHVYWTVQPYVGNERATLINRRLRQQFDGDKAVVDPSRVLRLAGTLHLKNPSQPHLVTCWALGGYGRCLDPAMLEIALASVNVSDGGQGGRHELGEPLLAAPSLAHVRHALNLLDPNDLERDAWISTLAAAKQAAWTHGTANEIDAMLLAWCSRYKDDDPGDDRKQIASIRNTELGWPSLVRRIPALQAETLFGGAAYQLPLGASATPLQPARPQPQPPQQLDGYVEIISTASGDSGKNTLIETVKLLHGNLPVAFDEFTQTVLATHPLPWDKHGSFPRQWTELDTIHCQLSVQALFAKPGKDTVHDAVAVIANKHKRHQVRDYLDALQWDGIQRLPLLASRYFGTPDTPYAGIIMTKFMVGAVARIMQPGCKMDNVVILEGKQGTGKSSAIAMLAGAQWFTDELPDLHTKDAAIQLAGKWIIEVSELSALKRSDVETIKKFMGRSVDTFRAPYERTTEDHPRQCVFVATTNDENYLKDQTGNRRFWPLACGTISVDAIKQDRDQLWAEAFTRYRNGERWWLEDDETKLAEVAQEERREPDPWDERIASHVATLNGLPTTFAQICFVLNIPFERLNSTVNKRVVQCLKRVGYVRKQVRNGEHRTWQYVKE
ncbi:hypothetical protein FJ945_26105 [Mesorhizobium sp. B2-4-9]|uniref:VapE domain-containing protein n=1 Tax=Mesorhizobium sp. B2-4-9 TaxID=2589940 RepID=UPI0011279AC9|nr:VapE domain-containing protein [Mesorhizobium sp. B2-4-9]TPL16963.1 hypothetical protein FJ945_26105 [Mesorhizobium sp. B2-4-9]